MSVCVVTINGSQIAVEAGTTILEAARKLNINIPTLCHFEMCDLGVINKPASCRICVVEVKGRRNLAPACATPVMDGMVIETNTTRALNARRTVLELMLSDHPQTCLTCNKNQKCELQKLAAEFGVQNIPFQGKVNELAIDKSSFALQRDLNKCIMCRRCESACVNTQTVGTLSAHNRGFTAKVATSEFKPLADTNCTYCGQCANVCPTGAISGISYTRQVWDALSDSSKTVIVQTAPAVRVAIGQEFGFEPGTPITGKMVAGLKKLGFNAVFDTNFSADLTIMEEANEIVHRLQEGTNLPILTSCCPGWINFLEFQFPDLLNIPSTCKSPQQMFGAIAKTYYADKIGVKPEDLIVVSVMPCQAKKYEAARPEFVRNGVRDVDYVVTTRELIRMFNEAGIDIAALEDAEFDSPLGTSTGAADLFGVTGGVLEAALRTAYQLVTKAELPDDAIVFKSVRGLDGVKEAEVDIAGTKLKVAAASGLGNVRKLLEKIRNKESVYHAIEVMACPGGCINGGGQPYIGGDEEILEKRMMGLYSEDESKVLRKSHMNPDIQQLYKEFLKEPGSHLAHELLHTDYKAK